MLVNAIQRINGCDEAVVGASGYFEFVVLQSDFLIIWCAWHLYHARIIHLINTTNGLIGYCKLGNRKNQMTQQQMWLQNNKSKYKVLAAGAAAV